MDVGIEAGETSLIFLPIYWIFVHWITQLILAEMSFVRSFICNISSFSPIFLPSNLFMLSFIWINFKIWYFNDICDKTSTFSFIFGYNIISHSKIFSTFYLNFHPIPSNLEHALIFITIYIYLKDFKIV